MKDWYLEHGGTMVLIGDVVLFIVAFILAQAAGLNLPVSITVACWPAIIWNLFWSAVNLVLL